MKLFKKTLLGLLAVCLIFIAFLVFNTLTLKSKQLTFGTIEKIKVDPLSKINFSNAIKIKTISPENAADFDSLAFDQFNIFIKETYPFVDSLLEEKTFNSYSHLYKWEGSDKSLKPTLFIAHLDVVPVVEANLSNWKHAPFGGEIVNDTIWGRGTIDDKIGVIGIMESVELLLKSNYIPKRTIYLGFGHDEEIGGVNGAMVMAEYLKEKNVSLEFVMDEGGTISQGLVPGIEKDVALIGTAEKGFVTVELSVALEGGHSSQPDKETNIDVLSNAIVKLKNNPFPARIPTVVGKMLEYLGSEFPFTTRMVAANQKLLGFLFIAVSESTPQGNANVRTTTAPTIFHSGVKENVLPPVANASVNFRILPGESSSTVLERVKKTVNDERISVEIGGNFITEPSKISSTETMGFQAIQKTLLEVFPGTLVSPYLVIGGTDSRHYGAITDDIYRFASIKLHKQNIKSFHGINEAIPVKELEDAIRFYHQLIMNVSQ
ncbi:M20 family peptidase [uncultured Arcticibacterium sp.]|uniref:M20 family peptidase n=1 Tax=uncultured Arcticibacterium sp. TaxID=2173042 RepID=UPI0030F998E9